MSHWGSWTHKRIIALLSLLVIFGAATAVTWRVGSERRTEHYVDADDPLARDDQRYGSLGRPWKTLEYALHQLRPGDTLFIRGGVYHHAAIDLSRQNSGQEGAPITVKPYGDETVVLEDSGPILFHGANWWTIEGLRFNEPRGPSVRFGEHEALGSPRTIAAEHIIVRDCEFGNAHNTALAIVFAVDVLIESNYFHHIRVGVPFPDESREINAIAIKYTADEIVIRNNRFEDIGSDGVHVGSEAYVPGSDIGTIEIANNEFWVNRPYRGILGNVGENGVDVKRCRGPVLIAGNTIHGFRPTTPEQDASGANGDGLVIHGEARNVTVERNLFYDNTAQLNVAKGLGSGPRNITIRNNIFRGTVSSDNPGYAVEGSALQVRSATDVFVYHNTFFDNERYLVSADAVGCVFKNNIVVRGRAQLNYDAVEWEADFNAWSQTAEEVPAILRGQHDLLADDLWLDQHLRPTVDSPVVGVGQDVGVKDDFDGRARPSTPTLGAMEPSSD